MSTKLYSYKVKNNSDDSDPSKPPPCHPTKTARFQSVAILIVAALPFTLASILVWYSRKIPSMAVTTYAGLTAMYACIYKVFDPLMTNDQADWWFGLWFAITGTGGLVICTYFFLSERSVERSRPSFQWGLVVTALGFGFGFIQILDLGGDTSGDWILLNLLVFVPLLLLGIVNGNMFLVFLGCVGFLADAARLAALIGDHVRGDARDPVVFVVFSLTGLAAGLLGFQLSKYQPSVHNFAKHRVDRLDECLNSSDGPTRDQESEEYSLSLLESSDAAAGANDAGTHLVSDD